jgi:hypothetical protein
MRRALAAATLVSALITGFRDARAQGEDALPLRRGTLRLNLLPDWARWNERFGRGTPGRTDGAREPLDVDFSTDSLGAAQLPFLAGAEARLRAVTGLAGLSLNLGRARLTLNNSVRVVPLGVDLAISSRLVVRALLPIVRARAEVYLLGPADTGFGSASVGLNPALATPGALDAFRGEVDAALAALAAQAATGPAGLRAQAQAAYDALRPLLCNLYTLGAGNASSSASPCFVAAGALASPVLPLSASAAGDSIGARLAAAQASYENLRQQYAAQSVTIPAFTAAYALPATALDSTDLRAMFARTAAPIGADSLASIVRTRVGNVELGAWYQLAMGPRWRSQVELTVRLPTGTDDSPHHFLDLGTGTAALGYELAWRNDLVLRPDFWIHAGARAGGWSSYELVRRVAPANILVVPVADTATVSRAPGLTTQLDLVPNWQLDDAFRLGVGVHWIRRGATTHTYVNGADATRIGLAASVLDEETEMSALRLGAGLTFSTLDRYARGRASLPYTVTASYTRVYGGSGGNVPAFSAFSVLVRGYVTLWR